MKYMGSKNRHAKSILRAITKYDPWVFVEYSAWCEPFVGGANFICKISNNIPKYGNDVDKNLIIMFQEIQKGWIPPDTISEEEYQILKEKDESNVTDPLIGFASIACSYAAKKWGGFARGKDNNGIQRNYCLESKNNLLNQNLKDIIFTHGNYYDMIIPDKSIIYCDPPYASTTEYRYKFDHSKFWNWCDSMIKIGHKVFVSEYIAPKDWNCIWEKESVCTVSKNKYNGCKIGVERLFTK